MKRRRLLVSRARQYHNEVVTNQHGHGISGYAPELNPDELVWNYMKRTGTARRSLGKGEVLQDHITFLAQPGLKSFFRAMSLY
ncbi:MAG: hypothetical protein U1E21_02640 [Reyranellaceae bacterium]